jgi:5'-nucleotidase
MALRKEEKAEEPPTTLRFVTINDVYELDDLPRYATALRRAREGAPGNVTVLGVLVGDFLAPSILSSLDHGHGEQEG